MTLAWPVVPFFPWWFKSGLEKQRCFNSFHFLSCSGLVFFPPSFSPALKKTQNPKIFLQQHKLHLTSASWGMDFSEGGRRAFFMWLLLTARSSGQGGRSGKPPPWPGRASCPIMTTPSIPDPDQQTGLWEDTYMEEESFLNSLLWLGGFGPERGRSYIGFPEYSWCTPNCIVCNGIFYCARNEISGSHCYLSSCSCKEFICEFYNIQRWFLCTLFQ